jgi:hypothetical protein
MIQRFYRVDRREICYLQAIIEAYDGIATVTTCDAGMGIVEMAISHGCEKEVELILEDLKTNGVLIENRLGRNIK